MEYIGAFTPQSISSGTFNLQYNHGHFLFINESYANLLIKGESWKFPLQSGQCRMICINQSGPFISYETLTTLQIANAVDAVLVEYYAPGEKYLEQYPSTLTRQAIVGNVVQTSGGSVAQLINDGNAANTQIIEATPSGDASSAIAITNDAAFTIGNATHAGSATFLANFIWQVKQSNVLHQVLKVQTSGKPLLIGNATDNVEVLLNLDVDNNLYVAGVASVDTISNATGSSIQFKINGTNIFQATTTGPNLNANMKYNLLTGSLSRMSASGISGVSCGSGTVISHGLGTTPVVLSVCPNIAQPGSATIGTGSVGATTFTATVGAGSSILFWCMKD